MARTVCDLADGGEPWETLALCDDAVARGAKARWIHARAEDLAKGRDGVRLVRDATAPGSAAEFRSWLEQASAHVYRAAGLPDPEWNVPVLDGDGEDVVHRPVEVAATVARALAARGADIDLARVPRRIDVPAAPYRGGWAENGAL